MAGYRRVASFLDGMNVMDSAGWIFVKQLSEIVVEFRFCIVTTVVKTIFAVTH